LLEKTLPWALETNDLGQRFSFFLGAELLLHQLRATGTTTVRLRLPASCPFVNEQGQYPIEQLHDWLAGEMRALAERFNARNGNDWYSRRIERERELLALRTPYPARKASATEDETE